MVGVLRPRLLLRRFHEDSFALGDCDAHATALKRHFQLAIIPVLPNLRNSTFEFSLCIVRLKDDFLPHLNSAPRYYPRLRRRGHSIGFPGFALRRSSDVGDDDMVILYT